jgi:PAS domain S-box-containing protein
MDNKKILIVEDERIVAEDIKNSVQNLGYEVLAVTSLGAEAVKIAGELVPDLVLMDIKLEGDIDGIEAANEIRSLRNIPVVYLTAHADENTLSRVKVSNPSGYIIKPFEDKELKTTLELALYKSDMEKKLKDSEKWFSTTLMSINDAVIATDRRGFVTFINPVAEKLTGWKRKDAMGKPIITVFNIIDEETGRRVVNHVSGAICGETQFFRTKDTVLKSKDGVKIPIEESCDPIKDDRGNIIGTVLVFRDITERKHTEDMLKQDAEELAKANVVLKQALDELMKRVEQRNVQESEDEITLEAENRGGAFLFPVEDKSWAYSLFLSMFDAGLPSLAVIRIPPHKFRETLGREVETVWLTSNCQTEGVCLNPSNITRLSMILSEFFKHAPRGIVLFEGLEYILSIVGFQDLLGLIQLLNDKIALNEGTIYLIFDVGVLEGKEARFILRECLQPERNIPSGD